MEKPKDESKNFLTHSKRKQEPQKKQKAVELPSSGEVVEAMSAPKRSVHEAALSGKMAKISSMNESGSPLPIRQPFSDKNKGASTLPQAMARVHRKQQENEIRERLQGKKEKGPVLVRKPEQSEGLRMDDPEPGLGKSVLWFLFSFGRFAKSVLLAQQLPVTILLWMFCGLGSILVSVGWLCPVAGPGPVYDNTFTSTVLAGGMLLGMGTYALISAALFLVVKKKFGGIGKFFGLKVMVNAFFPLALGQLLAMGYGTFALGESYWRGNVPVGYEVLAKFFLPLLWIWGGYRVSQAITGLFTMTLPVRIWVKSGITLLLALPVWVSASGLMHPYKQSRDAEFAALKKDTMATASSLPLSRYNEVERQIPFHDVNRRRDLYLYRMQNLYREDKLEAARADALRLDRMAKPGSADDELAKGLNYLFMNRLDLAIPRFQSAIELDPACAPAHQWLALGLVGADIDTAEDHARVLMRMDPNVFHMQLLVRILFAQKKYQEIWDVMLTVNAPPEEWDPLTLLQGGAAAAKLGKSRRAEFLYSLARSKGLESAGE